MAPLSSLVVLVLLTLAAGLAHVPAVREFALRQGQDLLLENQDLELEADRLDYNLFELSSTLTNVRIRNSATPDLPPFFAADRVYIDLSWNDLLAGRLTVEEGRIDGAELQYAYNEEGLSNAPGAGGESAADEAPPPEQAGSGELPFLIRDFTVDGRLLRYADPRNGLELELPEWNLAISGDRPSNQHVEFSTGDGRFEMGEDEIPIEGVSAALELRDDELIVESVQLSPGASRVRLQGSVSGLADPVLDLTAEVEANVAQLAQLTGLEQNLGGTLGLNAQIAGPLGDLNVRTRIEGRQLAYDELRDLDLSAVAAWSAGDARVEVESLDFDSPTASGGGSGSIALTEEAGDSRLGLNLRAVDLRQISRLADLPMTIASRLSGDVNVQFPGLEAAQFSGQGRVQLRPLAETPAEDLLPLAGDLRFRSADGRLVLDISELEALGAVAQGEVAIANMQALDGRLELVVPELAETVASADALLGSAEGESLVPTALSGEVRLAVDLGGTLDDPQVELALESANFGAADISPIEISADAAYSADAVRLDALDVSWQGQRLTANGEIGLTGDSPQLDLDVAVEEGSIETILAALGQDVPASGIVNLTANVGGTVDAPQATLEGGVSNLAAYGEDWGELSWRGALDGDVATLESLRLEKPQGEGQGLLTASGRYNLETGEYEFEADSEDLRLTSLELPSGEPLRGAIDFEASGSGTLEDPSLDAQLALRNLEAAGREWGDVRAQAEIRGDQADVRLEAPKFKVTADVQTTLEGPYFGTVELQIDQFELADLDIEVRPDEPLQGTISGRITAEGPLAEPEKLAVSAQLDQLQIQAAEQLIASEGPLDISFRDGRLQIQQFQIRSGGASLSLAGELPLEETGQPGAIELDGEFNLEAVAPLLALSPEDYFFSGILEIDGRLSGSLAKLEPQLSLALNDGIIFAPQTLLPLTDITLRLTADERLIELETLDAAWGPAAIQAQATVPTQMAVGEDLPFETAEAPGPARFVADVRDIRLAPLEVAPESIDGYISVHVEGQAPELSLEALQAEIEFPRLEILAEDLRLNQPNPSRIVIADSQARIESFQLTGPETTIAVSGTAGLSEGGQLDLEVQADANAAAASYLAESLQLAGPIELDLSVDGSFAEPQLDGSFTWQDGRFSLESPRLDAESLQVRLGFEGKQVNVEQFTGELNSGPMELSGSFELGEGGLAGADLRFTAQDLFLEFPEGLRTSSNVDVTFRDTEDNLFLVDGGVTIEDGSYRERLELTTQLMNILRNRGSATFEAEPNPFLSRIRYDLDVETENPLLVDNNLARLEAELDLELVGTYYRPSLLGRVALGEGGEIYLAENDYVIEQGLIQFTSEQQIRPVFNIAARTEVGRYDITMQITGSVDDLDTQFTADDPLLTEADVISLLLTGRTLEQAQESGLNIAREQALSYLTGRLGGQLSRAAERSLGLSRVRIEPNLISGEGDPSARLTIGQNLSRQLELIYSMDLTDSGDQIWVADYSLTRRFQTRGVKQSDNSYRFDFEHDLRFGLENAPERRREGEDEITITQIRFTGEPALPEEELRKVLGLEAGKKYDFFKTRKKLDKLRDYYYKQDRLEARVRLRREKQGDQVSLEFDVEAGPRVSFEYEPGAPDDVQQQVREVWTRGVFEAQRIDDAEERILAWLHDAGFLEAKISTESVLPEPDLRRVRFSIERGPRYGDVEVVFPGANQVAPEDLVLILERTDLRDQLTARAREVANTLERYYYQLGYLDAEVERPALELEADTGTGRIVIAVEEGPRFLVGDLVFSGNDVFTDEELRAVATPSEGRVYSPQYLEDAIRNLEQLYFNRGYNDVIIEFTLARRADATRVDVEFQIQENEQDVVREIVVAGNEEVDEDFIKRRLILEEGDVLVTDKTDRSRTRLYDTGAFALVDLETERLEGGAPAGREKGLRLTARIREVSPYRVRYGGFFDTERGPGVIVDLENHNTLGSARTLGFRGRWNSDFREARGYFNQPLFAGLPLSTTTSIFRSRELRQSFITDRTGFSVQQEVDIWRHRLIWQYGYRFERAHTFDREPDPLFDGTINVAPLTSTLTYDTRDEFLDATRGQFTSHGFEYAPSALGSTIRFVKYFGQYFRYIPFFTPKATPFDEKPPRPKLVYAGGLRLGLQSGLGQEIVPSERFYAGGGTTIRGFEQDAVGPRNVLGEPNGGEAVFIMNHEARFPLISIFEGVAFLDVGNVYETLGDFSFTDLRSAAGVGLRVRTPFFLLRADYGLKLDRRDGESRGAFFFSIGQAF